MGLPQLLNGFVWGWIIALVALGLNLIYGILGIVNVAHGTFYMLGAVCALVLLPYVGFWGALVGSVLLVALIGAVAERIVLRPLLAQPTMTILATFGILLVIEQTVALTFGLSNRAMPAPLESLLDVGAVTYPGYRILVAVFAVLSIIGLELFLKRTRWGSWIRAVSQQPELALVQGVPAPLVYSMTFALGTGLAALAGALTAPIIGVHYLMGVDIVILAFVVVIVGGVGNLWGSVVVAIGAAELENLLTLLTRPTAARMITFLCLGAAAGLSAPGHLWRAHVVAPYAKRFAAKNASAKVRLWRLALLILAAILSSGHAPPNFARLLDLFCRRNSALDYLCPKLQSALWLYGIAQFGAIGLFDHWRIRHCSALALF